MAKVVQNNNTPSATRKRKEAASSTVNPSESGPSKKKRKRKLCNVDGCPNRAQNGGVCIRHGAKVKLCSVPECSKQVKNGGVCWRHGSRKRCSVDECTNQVKNGGVCWRHGSRKRCSVDECTNQVVNGGVCFSHGATRKRCKVDECPYQAQNGGVCFSHGAARKKYICSVDKCTRQVRWRGLCGRHGAKYSCQFQYPTHRCTTIATYDEFCYMHHHHRNNLVGMNQQVEPAAEISDNDDEGDTQLNSKVGGNEGKGLKRQHSLPSPIAKKKDLAPASSKEDDVERNGGDEKSQLRGFMAETDQKDEGDEPVASHREVGPLKEFDEIAGGHNQDDGSKKEGDKLNEDIEWGGDDQHEYFHVDREVDDKSDYEKQSDAVPEEIAVDSEDGEKEKIQRLNVELKESKRLVADLKERLEEAARYKSSSESERAARQSELNDLRAQLTTKELELKGKTESIAALKQRFSELNAEKEDKLQRAAMTEAALHYQVEINSGVIEDLNEKLEKLTSELEEATAGNESLQSQLSKTTFAQLLGISKKEAAIAKLEGKVKDFEETFWKQKEEWKKLHAKLGEKSNSTAELKKSNKFLKIQLEFALNEYAKLDLAFEELSARSVKSPRKRGNKKGKGFGSLGLLEGRRQCINGRKHNSL